MKNILLGGIILLIIGVAVAPSINHCVVKASQEDEVIEVTTQACGIQGFGDTTVKLTREQYQDLEEYLVEFRARLNQTSTREEAAPIFKEVVVELNKYGLLPWGMSVKNAQRLITRYENSTSRGQFYFSEDESNCSNLFCILAGKTDRSYAGNLIFTGFKLLFSYLYEHTYSSNILFLWELLTYLFLLKNSPPNRIVTLFNFLNLLTFGLINAEGHVYLSNGWIFTLGLLGKSTCNGSFCGQIPFSVKDFFPVPYPSFSYLYTGVFGFTGIRIIYEENYSSLFLGTALRVNIEDTPPSYP
jgi:hypothetical protein